MSYQDHEVDRCYRHHAGVRQGYSQGTAGVQSGYSRSTVRVQQGCSGV